MEAQLDGISHSWWELCGVDCSIQQFNCPITNMPMTDPVQAEDGRTYSQKALEEWFATCERAERPTTSPMTNEPMGTKLAPNMDMRRALEEFVAKFAELRDAVLEGGKSTMEVLSPDAN